VIDSYREALEYLYGLTNYEIKSQFAYAPQFFDLRRVHRLLDALGVPHQRFRSVHVAGTKGKGSTCAMLESMLRSAGYRTGLYTSPHLHSFRERMQIGGTCIPESDFVALVRQIRPWADQDPELTTFEVATALAFLHFAQAGVEIAVVEVGLGGRLDATNVITPLVSVITTIGHDHMHILGNTLAEIAAEKAGIIKEGVPVVTAPQAPTALAVIERVCAEKRAALHRVSQRWQWRATQRTLDGQRFTIGSRRSSAGAANTCSSYRGLYVPLLGTHQLRNAAVVLTAVHALRSSGVEVSESAIRQGLCDVVWPARFEIMGRQPFFVVDGAHNVDSARALSRTLQQYFPAKQPWFVLAVLSDKDIRAVLKQLLPSAQGALFSRSRHPRAAAPRQLQEAAAESATPTEVLPDLAAATDRAIELAGPDGLVVAAGSFTTAGEVRESWLRLHGQPLPPMDPI
jgi:dihydrofolate synthase/folylpolyglutamate synthase